MESFVVRYRNLLVLLALLVAQILGLAMQVRRTRSGQPGDGKTVTVLRFWADSIVTPPEKAIHTSSSGISGFWNNYIDLRHARQENEELQKTIGRLRLEQAALMEDAKQGQRLQALLNFQQKYIYKTVPAQAIGTSGTDQSKVFFIDKGKADGLDRDMAVITPDGIVGKVRDVFPHSAQVLAINDQSSGAGVILESTRIRGILRGNAYGQAQIVDIISDQRIKPGEKVLTAGGDEIFPRGLPVGTVEKIQPDPDRDGFINVRIKPSANLDRLDEVLVITSTEPRFSAEQQKDLATSVEMKGAEAAALAEQQKKASDGQAEKLPGLIDPNLPADQQPLNDTSNPNPVAHPPQALHPDRFTPGNAATPAVPESAPAGATQPAPTQPQKKKPVVPQGGQAAAPQNQPQGNP